MIERYKKELDRIHADRELKNRLTENLIKTAGRVPGKKKRQFLAGGLCAACFALLTVGVLLRKPPAPSGPELPALTLSSHEFVLGGLGGSAGAEADFSHTDSQAVSVAAERLPVYQNPNPVREDGTYPKLSEEESREKLEDYAFRLGIEEYTLSESPVGMILESPDWSVVLVYRTAVAVSFSGAKKTPLIGGASKDEVLGNVRRLLEEHSAWFGLENPRIDVCSDVYHAGENSWQIRVIEDTGDPAGNLIAYQTNYIRLFMNEEGRLSMFRAVREDLSLPMGEYPLKTEREALQDLLEGRAFFPLAGGDKTQVLFSEMIYHTANPASEYFLPYYKFYLAPGNSPGGYVEAYVPAVRNEYLIFAGDSGTPANSAPVYNTNETQKTKTDVAVLSVGGGSAPRRDYRDDSFRGFLPSAFRPGAQDGRFGRG